MVILLYLPTSTPQHTDILLAWISVLFLLGENKQRDNFTSSAVVMNAGAPQRCILSSLLYSHFTHGCSAKCDRDHIIKFAGGKTDRENSEY